MDSKTKYPVYIVSKGRFDNPITALYFARTGIDYLIAVEPQEYDKYVLKLGAKRVLRLPFSNLGLGGFPARNYCWEHARKNGHTKHWVFDDNIRGFCKWVNGRKTAIDNASEAIRFVERYSDKNDIDIAGFEYRYFSTKQPTKKAFKTNVHVYSALLIKNDLTQRWRLKYNEDIDLCLQVLHTGGSTASCVLYLSNKISTAAKMKGGNQSELYKNNDPKHKLLKATIIQKMWPQYVKIVIRFGRYHHLINWKQFSKTVAKQ